MTECAETALRPYAALDRDFPRTMISAAELVQQPIVAARTGDAVWEAFWTLAEHRGDREPPKIRYTSTQTEELELVRAGIAISITVSSVARLMPAPTIAYIPISDVPRSTVAVGWHADRSSSLIEAFIHTARTERDAHPSLLAELEAPHPAPSPKPASHRDTIPGG